MVEDSDPIPADFDERIGSHAWYEELSSLARIRFDQMRKR